MKSINSLNAAIACLHIAGLCVLTTAACERKSAQPKEPSVARAPTSQPTLAAPADAQPAVTTQPAAPLEPSKTAAAHQRIQADRLSFAVPAGWVVERPTSSMRKAQLRLPGTVDAGDAELVIFNFGHTPEAGGSVEANFERWCGQFTQADGGDTASLAPRKQTEIAGMAVHSIDIGGRYVAAMRPGAPEMHDKPGHRMLGSVIITPEGKYFLKLLGPQQTVQAHAEAYDSFLLSLKRD